MSNPPTGKAIAAFFERLGVGTQLTCMANTYKPQNVGMTGTITRLGRTSLRITDKDGVHSWLYPPKQVGGFLRVTDDEITYRIGRDDHTATWRTSA